MRRALLSVAAVATALVVAGCSAGPVPDAGSGDQSDSPGSSVVTVAAASDLKFALDEIAALAQERDPSLDVKISYGSSGTFLQQIQNGAPYDLYLSADLSYPERLVDEGLANAEDVFPYAVGRLVLWVPDGSPLDPVAGLPILLDPAVRRVAIANPEHAPYGQAAVAALKNVGLYEEVAAKFVLGENVAQAAEFVQSGNADAGILALSLALSKPLSDVGAWVELPLESYPRLDQGGVVLANGSHPDGARSVRDVMRSSEGAEILASYGFALPGR